MSAQQPLPNFSSQTLPPPNDPLGVDLMMDGTGDIIVTGSGDFALVSGPENCVQALTLRVRSSPGDIPLWPDYGSQFNENVVGSRSDPTVLLALATSELHELMRTDRRFVGVDNIAIVTFEQEGGLAAAISCELVLTNGVSVTVADLAQPRISDVVDPTFTDIVPFAVDPLDYATIGDQEYDTLDDIDEQQALLNDLN